MTAPGTTPPRVAPATPAMPTPAPTQPVAKGVAQRSFRGCSQIDEYEMMKKLGEGTFGEVHQARHRLSNEVYALKKILIHNEKDGFPITALREIKLLKMLSHDNCLKLEEMAVERPKAEGRRRAILYMVTPYFDHDLSGLLDNPEVHLSEAQIKCYMLQLFKGLRYLHDNNILHRDMKAANILINNRGRLLIADFGLARHYSGPPPRRGRGNGVASRDYTSLVVTRWYRPPELLLQLRQYTPAIDMWGAGCVFGEMFKKKPILSGQSDAHQMQIICELVGSPNSYNMPGWDRLPGHDVLQSFPAQPGCLVQRFREMSTTGLELLSDLLKLDWTKRINAIDAIDHPYFKTAPLPMREEDIPSYAASHELDRRNARGQKAALPPAPAGGTVGGAPNGEWTGTGPPTSQPHWPNSDRPHFNPRDRPTGPPRGPPPYDNRGNLNYGHRPPPPPPPHHQNPPPPPPRHQPHWGNSADRGPPPFDRGPPPGGPPPFDRGPHPGGPPPYDRVLPPPPTDGRHPLPRPPRFGPGGPGAQGDRLDYDRGSSHERGPPHPHPHQHRGPSVDKYIPSYHDPDAPRSHDVRPPRHADDRSRGESHDSGHSRDGLNYRDGPDRGRAYRDRLPDVRGPPRDARDRRVTRSRSPEPRRDARSRDHDRDRNIYRR